MGYLNTVHESPAFKVLELPSHYGLKGGAVKAIPASGRVALMYDYKGHRLARIYSPGSVASYAINNNECPFKGVERAKALGHKLYWLNPCGVTLSANPKPQEVVYEIKVGDKVWYQGKYFEIRQHRNSREHLDLIEIEAPESIYAEA